MIIQWLSDNVIWLTALGAIATIIALFKRNSTGGSKVTAKNGSVAAGKGMKNVSITISKSDADD